MSKKVINLLDLEYFFLDTSNLQKEEFYSYFNEIKNKHLNNQGFFKMSELLDKEHYSYFGKYYFYKLIKNYMKINKIDELVVNNFY